MSVGVMGKVVVITGDGVSCGVGKAPSPLMYVALH